MALETAEYLDELQPSWPVNTDAISAGDDHIRLIKRVLQNTFPLVTGPVGVSDTVLTRGAVPVGAITVFYMAAAPTGWARVTVEASKGLRVVPTASPGGVGGGTDDPIVNAKVPAHYHAIGLTSQTQNASHAHAFSGDTGNESNHTHWVAVATGAAADHQHYINFTSGATAVVNNTGGIEAGGGDAALTSPNITHTHTVQGWSDPGGAHSHTTSGYSDPGSAHSHAFSGTSAAQNANHAHAVSGNSATPTVSEPGGTLGAWRPRYLDVILCRRTS